MGSLVWQQWAYLVLAVISALTYVMKAGQPRPAYPEGGELAFTLVFGAVFAVMVLTI